MKRLTYISKLSRSLTSDQIEEIGKVSQVNNARYYITGVLLYSGGIFFQILEGDTESIDMVYARILNDDRHTEILCLKNEENVTERLFPEWSMKTINLDDDINLLIKPIKTLLNSVTESHRILEKYTQPTIFRIMKQGLNPLDVPPRSIERIIMFSDIMSFSTLMEKIPVEEVVELVNQYCTLCTEMIINQGGEVTKFMGDCVMSYFPVELADNAIQAAIDILTEIEKLRNSAPEKSILKLLYTGIGISQGMVIEGNIGSSLKKDYTILGDAVNVAQRLESLTRELPWYCVFSSGVKDSLKLDWELVELGNFAAKGKEKQIKLYSIKHPITMKKEQGNQFINYLSSYLSQVLEKGKIKGL